ncbi:MAG: hypothetical protein KDI32_05125, partial [Pseudomonadales bacterium]|nr:hypothetical protein [Pseudomonadales bacterium]
QERVRIRKELRQVRLGLEQDIRALGARIKLINIVIVPALFAALALAVAALRRRRRHSSATRPSEHER